MSRDVVVDASAAAPWLLPDERSRAAEQVLRAAVCGSLRLLVPELWRYETLNLIRSAVSSGRITAHEGRRALRARQRIPVHVAELTGDLEAAVLALALENHLSAYDATYAALAQGMGLDLVTEDKHLLALKPTMPWICSLEEFAAQRLDPSDAEGGAAGAGGG